MKELLALLASIEGLDPKVRENLEAKIKATEKELIGRNSRENKKAIKDAVELAKKELEKDLELAKKKGSEKDTELEALTSEVEKIKTERAEELYDKKFSTSGIDPKYKEFVKGKYKDKFDEALKDFPDWKQKPKVVIKDRTIEREPEKGTERVPFKPKLVQGE